MALEQVRIEDLAAITKLNVYAPVLAMQAVIPAMRRQSGGAIVNVSSMTSRMVLPGAGAYSATKAALNLLSHVARRELAADGIVVSLVYPSVTATEFCASLRAGARLGGGGGPIQAQPAEHVAEAIIEVIRSGETEVLPGQPTR